MRTSVLFDEKKTWTREFEPVWTRDRVNFSQFCADVFYGTRATRRLLYIVKRCFARHLVLFFAGDYQLGANAAGFKKVADAMIEQGQVFTNKL